MFLSRVISISVFFLLQVDVSEARFGLWCFAFGSFVSVRGTVRYPDGELIHPENAKPATRRLITPSWLMGLCLNGCVAAIAKDRLFHRFLYISLCALVVFSSPDGVSEAGPRGEEDPPFQATERQGDAGMHRILFNRYPMLKVVYLGFWLHMFHDCPCIVIDNDV